MKEEFNLSEKIIFGKTFGEKRRYKEVIKKKDVKEFIKRLKEELGDGIFETETCKIIFEIIDKFAGKELVQ